MPINMLEGAQWAPQALIAKRGLLAYTVKLGYFYAVKPVYGLYGNICEMISGL